MLPIRPCRRLLRAWVIFRAVVAFYRTRLGIEAYRLWHRFEANPLKYDPGSLEAPKPGRGRPHSCLHCAAVLALRSGCCKRPLWWLKLEIVRERCGHGGALEA